MILVVAAVVVIGAIGAGKRSWSLSSGNDTLGRAACTHFVNIASDAAQGVLGPDQLLTKIRKVWDDAQYADTPGVREGARQMLSSLNGQGGDFQTGLDTMTDACASLLRD